MALANRTLLMIFLCAGLLTAGCGRKETPKRSAFAVADGIPPRREADAPAIPESSPEADSGAQAPIEPAQPPADPEPAEVDDPHPFPTRLKLPPIPEGVTWLNTSGPLRLEDLQGKFVLFDFWTYCCINCMHVLPELKKLEEKYPNQLVVIGVHSAKFETEQVTANIEEAILRYNIAHPVVNDANHVVWDTYGISSWPTLLMIDPEGMAVLYNAGEIKFEMLDEVLQDALPYYREKNLLDETPIHFDLLAAKAKPTPVRFPGKVMADESSGRLFISDSNHNRILVTDLEGKLLDTIGSGAEGKNDGDYQQATFKQPQGVALHGETLYVADTENHLLRKVDLAAKNVITIAGTGKQGRGWPGMEKLTAYDPIPERWVGPPRRTGLNSPWALLVHGETLFIAMAGPHQIWSMPLDESEIGLYAGNGREDIVDGPLMPETPFEGGISSFAQPSGLTTDGTWLYVADSEGSSIRAVPFDSEQEVRTVIGTSDLPGGRLFAFGDIDGPKESAMLQHALGVTYHEGNIYTADTYNNKIKVVDAATGAVKTLAGTRDPGFTNGAGEAAQFDEPAGISYAAGKLFVADTNNHAIRVIDLSTAEVSTLEITGLEPPAKQAKPAGPNFADAPLMQLEPISVKPVDGKVTFQLQLTLPEGWKLNPLAPMGYRIDVGGKEGPLDRTAIGTFVKVEQPDANLPISVPVTGEGFTTVDVSLIYYYCSEGGEGVCKVASVVWRVPVTVEAKAEGTTVVLPLNVRP